MNYLFSFAFACLPIFYSGNRIDRWEGILFLFLFYYAAYIGYLVLDAIDRESLPGYGMVMLAFVIPLTAIILVAVTLKEKQHRKKRQV